MNELPNFANVLNEPRQRPEEIEIGPNATALDLLRVICRCRDLGLSVRMRAAIGALPFETPKLAVTYQASETDFATLLDRRIEQMKLIEGKPTNGAAVEAPRVADRRFRRI